MSVIEVTFPGNLAQVDSASALRAIPSIYLENGDLYAIRSNGGIYTWDPSSYLDDDDQTVIRPNDITPLQIGRWILGQSEIFSGLYVPNSVLSSRVGSDFVGTQRATLATAGQLRPLSSKLADRFDARDIAGFSLNPDNDNTAALQAGFNDAAAEGATLYFPGGVIATSTVNVPQGTTIQGMGRARGVPATRFLFTDANPGFLCGDGFDGNGFEDGFLFRDIVTSRMQPPPPLSGAWTPIDAAADFVMNGATDLDLEHVLFLNSTRAVNMLGGGGIGRLNMDNCGGQVFAYGVNIELAADTCKFTNVHWWPFWSDTKPVNAYSSANADHFWLKRCDSPQFVNVSSIAARSGFRFSNNSQGGTSKAQIANAALDYATTNIWFDSTSQNAWASFSTLAAQANNSNGALANIDPVTPRRNILMEGTNCQLSIDAMEGAGASGSAVIVGGTSNRCTIDGPIWVNEYGTGGGTDPGFSVALGCTLALGSSNRCDNPGAGPKFGGAGYISTPDYRAYIPTISATSGSIASYTINGAIFQVLDNLVSVDLDITVTDNGSGAGAFRATLPVAMAAVPGTGHGRGPVKGLSVLVSGNFAEVLSSDGTYPASNGSRLIINFSYHL